MNLLALEMSSALFSVALKVGETCFTHDEKLTYPAAQNVLPVIQQLLQKGKISLNELDALVLGAGPGNFTGLRVAASVVQAIAFVYDHPVVLISSLRACAQAAFDQTHHARVFVAVNAYQGEIYWGVYQVDDTDQMQAVRADCVVAPSNVVLPDSERWLGVGDAWEIYAEILQTRCQDKLLDCQVTHYPTAAALIKLGENAFLRQEVVSAKEAVPVYLRGEDAWKKVNV